MEHYAVLKQVRLVPCSHKTGVLAGGGAGGGKLRKTKELLFLLFFFHGKILNFQPILNKQKMNKTRE